MVTRRRSDEELREVDAIVERLRDFIRLNYISVEETACRIGFSPSTLFSWLNSESRPAKPERIAAFLDSVPTDRGSGIAPTGYEYREYKNWRGIPKPRRCPFCKSAKGEIEKVEGGHQGVCPNCRATGPKRESYDEALMAWNGRMECSGHRGAVRSYHAQNLGRWFNQTLPKWIWTRAVIPVLPDLNPLQRQTRRLL